jgi:hypothetical protein
MLRSLTPQQVEAEIHSADNRYYTSHNYGVSDPTEEQLAENWYRHNIVVHIIEFYVDEQLPLPFPNLSDAA